MLDKVRIKVTLSYVIDYEPWEYEGIISGDEDQVSNSILKYERESSISDPDCFLQEAQCAEDVKIELNLIE
jgi:hypothetical protein